MVQQHIFYRSLQDYKNQYLMIDSIQFVQVIFYLEF